MKPKDIGLANQLRAGILSYSQQKRVLHGIQNAVSLDVLIEQLVESIHRIKYISIISQRDVSPLRIDPSSSYFDPERAAVFCKRQGQIDEAFWFVFLSVHFGKNARGGWRYAREVYGCLGGGAPWNWARTSADPSGFRKWLAANQHVLKRKDPPGGFGNHRKYESLHAYSNQGTGAAFESYINWVGPQRSHLTLMQKALDATNRDPRKAFHYLYQSMNAVKRFGRTAKFDYLTMIGKLGLAPIEPGSAYMQGATGPVAGARLLFCGNAKAQLSSSTLDTWLVELEHGLGVGMQVMEDALCNWQKSPYKFRPFRG